MAAVVKCKGIRNTEDNTTGESGTLNMKGELQPKQSSRKGKTWRKNFIINIKSNLSKKILFNLSFWFSNVLGFVFPLAQEVHLSTSTETSASTQAKSRFKARH